MESDEEARDEAARRAKSPLATGLGLGLIAVAGSLALGVAILGVWLALRPSQTELARRVLDGDQEAGHQLLTRASEGWVGVAEREAQPYGELYGFGQALRLSNDVRQDPKPGTATGWPLSTRLEGRPLIVRPYRIIGEGGSRAAFMAYLFDAEGRLVSAKLHVMNPKVPWDMAEFEVRDEVLTTYPPDGPSFKRVGDELVQVTPGRR